MTMRPKSVDNAPEKRDIEQKNIDNELKNIEKKCENS